MTMLEALNLAVETLNGISIPVPQLQTIGLPISRANELIQASIDAIQKNMKAKETEETEEAEETEEEPSEAEPV